MICNNDHIQTLAKGGIGDSGIIPGAIRVRRMNMKVANEFSHQVDFFM